MSSAAAIDDTARRPLACPAAVIALALAGAWAAASVHGPAAPPPAGTGWERLGSPDVVLASYDTLWALLVLPGQRLAERLTLLLVGLPFHVALAAAAAAGGGHALATALLLGGYGAALSVPAPRSRFPGLALALVTCAAPLVGYALLEFAAVDAVALLRCSPLTAPTLLARSAPDVAASAGVPALAGVAFMLGLDQVLARVPGRREP